MSTSHETPTSSLDAVNPAPKSTTLSKDAAGVDPASGSAPASGPQGSGRRARFLERVGSFWTLGVLILIVLIFVITTPYFLSLQTWLAVSLAAAAVSMVAVGETFVIVSRGIDLSVGSVLGLSGMVAAYVMVGLQKTGMSGWVLTILGFVVCIVVGLVIGTVNGLVITKLNVQPFITTLGMLGIAAGITQLVGTGDEIIDLPTQLLSVGNNVVIFGLIPVPVLIAGAFGLVAALFLKYTRFGRRTYAIGSNSEAALRTGINVLRHQQIIYAISGVFAGIAGFLVLAQLGIASVHAGENSELLAIAAVVIGGTSLFGGRGNIAGSIIGTLIVAVLETGLVIAKVSTAWQVIAVGFVLILAVWLDQQRERIVV